MPTLVKRTDRPRSVRLAVLAVLTALTVVAAACGSSSSSNAGGGGNGQSSTDETPVDGGTLVVAVPAETNGWNPAANQWEDSGNLVGSAVFEPLASVGADKSAQPWLADSWTANATNDVWVVKLHPNVTFQNGEPFDAAAVKQNLEFELKSPLSSVGIAPLIAGAEVIDPLTVQFDLKQPWGAFPSSYLAGALYMMAPEMMAMPDQGSSHPIGTGPFTFDSWQAGGSFKAKKNPNYWQHGLPHLDSIEFRVIPDDTTRAAALESGDVNLIQTASAATASDVPSTDTVVKDWSSQNSIMVLNTSAEKEGNPFGNIHARKALAYATDRDAVAALVGAGVETGTGPWSPSNPWGLPDDQNGYPGFDLDQAKSEVDQYKADTGASSLSFTVLGVPGSDDEKVLQMLQSQFKDAGIDMKVDIVEQTAFISSTVVGDFQAMSSRNYGYADPDTDVIFWSKDTAKGPGNLSINFSQYTTPETEQSLMTGRQSTDVDVRRKAYNELVPERNAGVPELWLYRVPYSLIADPTVKGLDKPATNGFAALQPKTWWGDVWRTNG